jgi:phosphoenolpyruvate carboxykinase (GTP)
METPIGCVPRPEDLDLDELEGASPEMMRDLLAVNANEWEKELDGQEKFFETLEPYVPNELHEQRKKLTARLGR